MVIVRGASGAGKTSLLRAGLTHILSKPADGKDVNYHYWEATPTEPDKWLLHAIRETWPPGLEDATKPSTLDELVNPSDSLGRQSHVIVLDQFEQLRGSKPIFRLLRRIAREAKPPHRINACRSGGARCRLQFFPRRSFDYVANGFDYRLRLI
jgi:hypothetical protein